MLNICFITVVSFLCMAGIYFTVKEVISMFMHNDAKTTVFLEIHNNTDDAEQIIRSVLFANPNSKIYVADKSDNDEITEILAKLAKENNQIYIKTAPEK